MTRKCLHSRSYILSIAGLLLFIISILPIQANGQQEELVRVITSPGNNPYKVFPKDKRYRFSSFQKGHIYTSNQKEWAVNFLNYDFYLGGMLTIEKGDTLLVNDLTEFKYLEVNGTPFIHLHEKGYYEVLAETNSIKLGVREKYSVKRRERHINNGYGDFNDPTAASRSSTSPYIDILFNKEHFYALVDAEDTFYKANKSNFLKLFPNHRDDIETFFHSHHANFYRREDLIRLFQLCSALNN